MKHMSQSVQASNTAPKSSDVTSDNSSFGLVSIRSNRRGKESQRLKQRRQPWQMSKTRRISASSFAGSVKSGSCQRMVSRVGASRLPSPVIGNPWVVLEENGRATEKLRGQI